MSKVLKKLRLLIDGAVSITGAIAAGSIVAAALIVTEGIVVRKVFGISAIWQIEASVFLLIFATFMGAPLVQRREKHLNVDLILVHLSPKTSELVLIVVSILTCILCGILAWVAWPMWWESLAKNEHSMSLWGPPLWIPYIFLPLGMSLLFFVYILHIAKKIASFRKLGHGALTPPAEDAKTKK